MADYGRLDRGTDDGNINDSLIALIPPGTIKEVNPRVDSFFIEIGDQNTATARAGVFQGGSLGDPEGADLVTDFGETDNALPIHSLQAIHSTGQGELDPNLPIWVVLKGPGGDQVTVRFDENVRKGNIFVRNLIQTGSMGSDPTVAFPSSIPSLVPASIGTMTLSIYISVNPAPKAFSVPSSFDIGTPDVVDPRYEEAFGCLLPSGKAFGGARTPDNNVQRQVSEALSHMPARLRATVDGVLTNAFPHTADNRLSKWEDQYGLTGDCDPNPPTTVAGRQAALQKHIRRGGRTERGLYDEIAKDRGYPDTQLDSLYRPFTMGAEVGSPLQGGIWAYSWSFRVCSKSDEDDEALKCALEKIRPAHQLWIYDFFVPAPVIDAVLPLETEGLSYIPELDLFVAFATDGDSFYKWRNPDNWFGGPPYLPAGDWHSVVWTQDQMVAVGGGGACRTFPPDFTAAGDSVGRTTNVTGAMYRVIRLPSGRLVSFGGDKITVSDDSGSTWTVKHTEVGKTLYDIDRYEGTLMIVGDASYVATSTDEGDNWSSVTAPAASLRAVRYGAGVWVVADDADDVHWSDDTGSTWNTVAAGHSSGPPKLEYATVGGFIMVSDTEIYWSRDGKDWSGSPATNPIVTDADRDWSGLATDGAGQWWFSYRNSPVQQGAYKHIPPGFYFPGKSI